MRALLRILAFLLALPLLMSGCVGMAFSVVGPEALEQARGEIEKQIREGQVPPDKAKEVRAQLDELKKHVEGQTLMPFAGGALGGGLVFFLYAVWPRKKKAQRAGAKKAKAREKKGQKGAEAEAAVEGPPTAGLSEIETPVSPTLNKKELKKLLKTASEMEEEQGAEEAATYLIERGLRDEAVEVFIRHEIFDRAAEVRSDQNRFDEAAELFQKARRFEAAASIFAQQERFEDAARCYLEVDKKSVAGEMFERAENYREAGRCYREIGFHRHAANAFLKAGAKGDAATSLIEAFTDEGGGGQSLNDAKAKELRALARKAGELLVELERLEEAEKILVKASLFGPAAKVAYTLGAYDRASELFLRVGRGDLASKALIKLGDAEGAARALGEYLREKGDFEGAVEQLAAAGDHSAAGDLYRRLERYAEAGEAYAQAMDYPAAAEMFRVADLPARAAECFERANDFEAAAEAYKDAGDWERYGALLERGGRLFEAGQVVADNDRTDEAIRLLQAVESTDPRYAEACALLGQLFETKGMISLSIKKFEEAAGDAVNRANVGSFYRLACAHQKRGAWADAVETFEKILSFDYHYEDVAKRLEHCKGELKSQAQSAPGMAHSHGGAPPSQPNLGLGGQPITTRYEIVRELGRGGMGVVYQARDSVLERDVAYKVLPEGLRGNPNALKNFLREAKAAAQLNHPNIVTVYDAGESEHGFYMAMELVDGTTLKEIVRARGAVAAGGVIYILRQMAEALAFAHGKKVVHRDIKTANTMWTRDKQVKIMDFGLAKLMEEVRNATTLISGTPFYMSPEQTLGQNVDHRTDIYSLGVTLFELATGDLPFRKGNVPYHHVHTPPPDPCQANPEVPSALGRIILRCLAKDPEERYPSARDLLDEIDRLTAPQS